LLEVFQDFEISGDRSALTTFLSRLVKALPNTWRRDRNREKEIHLSLPDARHFVFQVAARKERPAAALFIMVQGHKLRVANVVPTQLGQLTRSEYNSFIEELARLSKPIANQLGLVLYITSQYITSHQLDIATLLTPPAFQALRAFSALANKSTGSSHPTDRRRWLEFLVLEHRGGGKLDAEVLRRWLIEEEKWPESEAYDLASEFDFAGELLRIYDAERS
jgi:hypothetical protein